MIDQTDFRQAVGEIPPTSVDVERIIRDQRRRHALTRTALGAAVAAAVLGVVVPIVVVAGPRPGPPAASPAPTPSSAPTPRPAPGTTFGATDRALFAALAREAPDVGWITEDWPSDGDVVTWRSTNSTSPYFGQGPIRAGDRTGYFVLQIERDWDRRVAFCVPGTTGKARCAESVGPGGEKVTTWSNEAPLTASARNRARGPGATPVGPPGDRFASVGGVAVERPDGTVLIADVVADGERSPLTVEQLTAIALDPTVRLY
ncbi:hypothetical protein [Micromonospora maritima]|uniref:hypothetical protein n=1 Tax=Micromonospora maritima TaxID=986711 RepID=UPI00157C5835|nr:hypothetical protein [Micromonospora maritima]